MVEVKILNGSRSIGGNCVRIEDKDRVLIFDQGIRFDLMTKYYSSFIMPQSLTELRDIGIIPKPEWYEDVVSVYITHMHLDHLGVLSNIPKELTVYLPSISIYSYLEEKWSMSPTWTSLIPRKYYVEIEELNPLEADKNNVIAVPVSHSAYPSFALLYFGTDENILYTGDFRTESFLDKDEFFKLNKAQDLMSYLENNRDIKVDTLIIEGTNFGTTRLPISPSEAMSIAERLTSTSKSIIVTTHSLDLEYILAFLKIAAKYGLNCYIATTQITKLLETVPELPISPAIIEEHVTYPSHYFEKVSIDQVEPKALIFVSYRGVVDFLKDISSIQPNLSDFAAIISEPEPQVEEAYEYGVIANWFLKMGIQSYRIRVSGHYYPYQLRKILENIRPTRILPIHTLYPERLKSYLG
ncbi:MAG: MBL fold metallo-hydrolase [Deltaproteobacteria bacterium]|nr:MBL fold metallo-hydrolase [Deltaproteobacteria bacterium]